MEEQTKPKFPTEVIELPSKGYLYSPESELSSGKVEMKYMTAREEDILTNQNFIEKGIVIDKLLQSLIVSKINYDDLLVGDKNAILIAARVLGYGKDYTFSYLGKDYTIDLTTLENKPLKEELFTDRKNEFEFTLPATEQVITFKLLTHADEKLIEQELQGLKKINKDNKPEASTRLKYSITSVGGDRTPRTIRDFVDNYFLARDARAFREYVREIQPDVNTKFYPEGGPDEGIEIPFGISFFWPDTRI
jgi:hypothetical protein